MVLIAAPSMGALEADLLVKWVHFLSTTGEFLSDLCINRKQQMRVENTG